jgi:hypothetical protein
VSGRLAERGAVLIVFARGLLILSRCNASLN